MEKKLLLVVLTLALVAVLAAACAPQVTPTPAGFSAGTEVPTSAAGTATPGAETVTPAATVTSAALATATP